MSWEDCTPGDGTSGEKNRRNDIRQVLTRTGRVRFCPWLSLTVGKKKRAGRLPIRSASQLAAGDFLFASLHPCNLEVFSTGISGLLGGEKLKDADATGIQLSSI
jgi:hypothetical protein